MRVFDTEPLIDIGMSVFKKRDPEESLTYSDPPRPALPGASRQPPEHPGRSLRMFATDINIIRCVFGHGWCLGVPLVP